MKKLGNRYLIGQTTGFEALDKKTTGFNEGDLVIIAARPAMGKTTRDIEHNRFSSRSITYKCSQRKRQIF